MATTVDLGDKDAVVRRLVAEGRYASVDEALRQGVSLIQQREQARAELRAKLDEGIADADAGRLSPIDEMEARLLAELYEEYPDVFEQDASAA